MGVEKLWDQPICHDVQIEIELLPIAHLYPDSRANLYHNSYAHGDNHPFPDPDKYAHANQHSNPYHDKHTNSIGDKYSHSDPITHTRRNQYGLPSPTMAFVNHIASKGSLEHGSR